MPSSKSLRSSTDMLPEYDFSGGVRGKYTERYRQGTNLVLLDPDVAATFPDSASVNNALRLLADVAERQSRVTSKRKMAKAKTTSTQAPPSGLRRRRAARS
jgi:hypothetical protein